MSAMPPTSPDFEPETDRYVSRRFPRLYGSYPTFYASPLAETHAQIGDADLTFLGVPWRAPTQMDDFYRGGRRGNFEGTALTPSTFRLNSLRFSGFLPELDIDIFDHFTVCDRGDVDVALFDIAATMQTVETEIEGILAQGSIPIVMGGNAGPCTYPVVKALANDPSGPLTILNLDAHGDNGDIAIEADDPRLPRWTSTWALRTLELEKVDPSRYFHFGLRGPANDRGTIPRFVDRGVERENIITYRELRAARRSGFDGWLDGFVRSICSGTGKVWIAVDPDVLTAGTAPDFDESEPLGPTTEETMELFYEVGRIAGRDRIAGVSVMATPPDAMALHRILLYLVTYLFAGASQHQPNAR